MGKWGGPREGAGRKPKEPGQKRVTLSTRISGRSSEHLRAYADRTGKTISQVIDEFVEFIASQPTFQGGEGAFAESDYPGLVRTVNRSEAAPASDRSSRELELEHLARANEAQRVVLESILHACPAGLLYLDREMYVRWVNPAYLRLRMRSAVEYLNRHLFREVSRGTQCPLESVIARVVETGEPHYDTNFPYAALADDPEKPAKNYSVLPVFGEGRHVSGVLLCVHEAA